MRRVVPIVVLSLVVLFFTLNAKADESESGKVAIPTCDSKEAIDNLKEAIGNGAFSKVVKLELLDLDKLAQVSFDKDAGVRKCIGDAVLNTGNGTISYTFSRTKMDPSKYLVQVEELNDAEAALARAEASKPDEQKRMEAIVQRIFDACIKKANDEGDINAGRLLFNQCFARYSQRLDKDSAHPDVTAKAILDRLKADPADLQTFADQGDAEAKAILDNLKANKAAAEKAAADKAAAEDIAAAAADKAELAALQAKAEQGDVDAQNNLGSLYEKGQGVPQDYAEAAKWYRKAADQGDADAKASIDAIDARAELQKKAEQGDADAQSKLGLLYASKGHDYAEAAKWLRKAADQGNANAQSELGHLYDQGQGVDQDYDEAAKWLRKAADQGNANAQKRLGLLYQYGAGVRRDYAEAAKWYRKAADRGNAEAKSLLDELRANWHGDHPE